MKMLIKICFLIPIFFLSIIYFTYSDYGPFSIEYGKSGTITPIENKNIKMEEAIINITKENFSYNSFYECKFKFKNKTNIVQTVIMGFPIVFTRGSDWNKTISDHGKFIKNYQVTVNGEEINWEISKNVKEYDLLYYFEAMFKPGEIKHITNTFEYSTYIDDEEEFDDFIDHLFLGANSGTKNEINYILKTGSLWAESIGKLSITITFRNMPFEIFSYKNYGVTGFKQKLVDPKNQDIVILEFKENNYEPTDDMLIIYSAKDSTQIINEYIKKKNYKRLEHLLDIFYQFDNLFKGREWKMEQTHSRFNLNDILTKKSLRYALYWTASNYLFRINTEKAIDYYKKAFKCVNSNKFGFDVNKLLEQDLTEWEEEPENDAPSYYIAFNIACAYSLLNDVEKAGKWVRIAIRLNPLLIKKLIKNDTDLTNLRNTEIYNDIVITEPQTITSIKSEAIDRVKKIYNNMKNNKFKGIYDYPANNGYIEFTYLPLDHAPYALIIYYEAINDSTLHVIFEKSGMYPRPIGEGKVDVKANSKGFLLIQIEPIGDIAELPENWSDYIDFNEEPYGDYRFIAYLRSGGSYADAIHLDSGNYYKDLQSINNK